MTIKEKQIFILTELRELGANIQPVVTHDFTDNILLKRLKPEEIKVCFELLEKRKFVETVTNISAPGLFATFITDEGMEEIERYELQEKERIRSDKIDSIARKNNLRIVQLTTVLAFGTIATLVWEIWKYFHSCCCH